MADYNNLPQTTIRHDPWLKANMLGEVAHCTYNGSTATAVELGLINGGSNPIALGVSYWSSVAFDAVLRLGADFTEASQQYSHFLNRHVYEVLNEPTTKFVSADLEFYKTLTSVSSDFDLKWGAAAGQRINPVGPNSFSGVPLIITPKETLILSIERTDGEATDREWNIAITWSGFSPDVLTLASPV
jgi:hypothetical protein